MNETCILCNNTTSNILYKDEDLRVLLVENEYYPGYLQVVLNEHIKELSDMSFETNLKLYRMVMRCESLLRDKFKPSKINIASLGNLVPHVHWHIIARFNNDRNFPESIWGAVMNPDYVPSDSLRHSHQELMMMGQHEFSQ